MVRIPEEATRYPETTSHHDASPALFLRFLAPALNTRQGRLTARHVFCAFLLLPFLLLICVQYRRVRDVSPSSVLCRGDAVAVAGPDARLVGWHQWVLLLLLRRMELLGVGLLG